MKFSEKWLREWVDPKVSTAELSHRLTMAGLEVDAIEPVAGEFEGVVVGEVLEIAPHPDADKLRVCSVNVGEGAALQIVCGAPNVYAGMKAPVALLGAKLPGGMKIKNAKLRGVASTGMLCSAKELQLADDHSGLMGLPQDAPVGTGLREYLDLDDNIIELGLTPNRGDCLGLAGVARETGVLFREAVSEPVISEVEAAIDDSFTVKLSAPADCPRYIGRLIQGIDTAARTPLWMVERLRRGGVRAISPVVDVTNYVLLELGQPMHAFDFDKLSGGIDVRRAGKGEKLTLLDGREVELDDDVLLISDAAGPLAMAGVMGGEHSAVGEGTRNLFLESAFFNPESIAGRARRYGLHTDASHRYERGVDPQLQMRAMQRATGLLLDIVGGQAGPCIEVASEADLPARPAVTLRATRLQRLLGVEIPAVEVSEILRRLGMAVESTDSGWRVTPPSFRFDIELEVDLIEEIGRIHGYDALPSREYLGHLRMAPRPEAHVPERRYRGLMVDRGYQEAITYSFVDPALQSLLGQAEGAISLTNPISSDLGVMRTSLWPGLVQAARYNLNRQQNRVFLFECGKRYSAEGENISESGLIAGVAAGLADPEQWGTAKRAVDFFDVKADVEAILECAGALRECKFLAAEHPALHPGQSARVERDGRTIGWLGVLHPELESRLGLPMKLVVFELSLDELRHGVVPAFASISKFPSIRRDVAMEFDVAIASETIRECARNAAGELLQNLQLFDVYSGKGVDSGRKSVALGLTLQASSRTLIEADVDAVLQRVMKSMQQQLGASLRE